MDSTNLFRNPTIDAKRHVYAQWFSSHTNTSQSFKEKMELYTLLCFLTQVMQKNNPEKYKSSLNVLETIYNRSLSEVSSGEDEYLIGLSIICDDLLWGTKDLIEKPEGVKTPLDIVNKIKTLIEQWLPF